MKRTPLYDIHKELGAKLVDFAGWEMPLQYQGIVAEHLAVRSSAGLFDVSHMGAIAIEGPDALFVLAGLSTNDLATKSDGSAIYTVWCDEQGGAIDDLIVYKKSATSFFVVANASNRDKDLQHLQENCKGKNVTVSSRYNDEGILSLQGPASTTILKKVFPEVTSLPPMQLISSTFQNVPVDISTTGYTGETGYELFANNTILVPLWRALMLAGQERGLQPIGLGARDTLRLEMGYALYGHELDDTIYPSESVSAWTVKYNHDFLGRRSLERLESSPEKRHQYGIVMEDRCIARQGCGVYLNGQKIGLVTSGTFSPSLQQPIAIVFVNTKLHSDDMVSIEIRNKLCSAKVTKLPFLNRSQIHKPDA